MSLKWAKFWVIWDIVFLVFNVLSAIINTISGKYAGAVVAVICAIVFWFWCLPTHIKQYKEAKDASKGDN